MVSQNERDAAYADGYNDGFRQGKQSRAHAPKETCPRCAGSGFETDSVTPCEFCGGDGLVFERDAEEYGATTTVEGGISWTALLAVLERLRSKNRNPDNQWYHGWNAAIQCLINDINARSPAAATAAPVEQSDEILCACRTFMLNDFNGARAYLDSCDFVHTVNGCPSKPVSADEGAR